MANQPPHFMRSLEAPTSATERGSNSGVRSLMRPSMRSTPRFSRPRATISRWISDVPSQMRSTRSSRRNRSATFVRM